MARIVYDACTLLGLLLCSAGAGLQWGLPVGLIVAGALLIVLTMVAVVIGGGRR